MCARSIPATAASSASARRLLIDCSTIDVDTARAVAAAAAAERGSPWSMRRCPAASAARRRQRSPSWSAAPAAAFARGRPMLETMGKTIIHAGGAGQRAGGQDLQQHDPRRLDDRASAEAFVLAEKLGLDAQKLFDIASKSPPASAGR